jgi:cytochrome b
LKRNKIAVWDAPVRWLHWLLVISIAGAWFTSSRTGAAHEYVGYLAAATVLARFVWGFVGSPNARFSQFILAVRPTLGYLRQVIAGTAPRYLGHNPLGGWMVAALLGSVAMLTLTGWLATTDLLWGYAWPVRIHAGFAWLLVGLIALHVAGVLFTSWQHRENLIRAMFSGTKDQSP